ncbi:glycosyltransferase [Deinococcus cavernae]|uniref:Glycosyltransferase n=1 Tax=Deinococcus cavernae TaxID=2320857 RepID=A0A418V784_9DEIO|nr:sugar transferase [Deinococcus cavernae]RJF71952.1 glycosyltransferase [Deinococcus cavernae]
MEHESRGMMPRRDKTILFAVTSSLSLIFLKGQIGLLKKKGWTTAVATAPATPDQLEKFAQSEQTMAIPVPLEREIDLKADLIGLSEMYRAIRKFRPTITNVGTPKAGLLGGLAAVAARAPIRIYTLHGLHLETAQGNKGRLLYLTERIAMACAHKIVCVSNSLREQVHELRLASPHKTLVLGAGSPNGVRPPPPADSEAIEALRQQLKLHDQSVIGFVGRFTRDKGMAELMEAFWQIRQVVPGTKLLLIGDYEEGDSAGAAVRQAIDQTPDVVRAGFVPDFYPYYPLMTVLALPTSREGFPTVALEAAAFGLPLVTTTATGARDVVQDGVTGWQVPVGDADALAQALLEALKDPEEAKRRGDAGREWVLEHFKLENVQQRWVDFYDELLHWDELKNLNPEKRWLDILAASVGLAALGLPMLGLAYLVRQKLGSPVLFKQVRPGLNGQPFTMYKFRTMTDERAPDGELLPDAVRLTSFGKFLRSTSLDELPELWNVLKGDMSLVGPRPLLMSYLPLYNERELRRHEVRPGVTGWAQVNGRNALSWEQKFEYDVWYVENHSLLLDLRILLMTLQKVFQREGISAAGEVTMPKFSGSSRDS